MSIRFFPFTAFHGKRSAGSTFIRVEQLLKYWPEAGIYKYGENPDVLIYQKVYVTQDYKFPAHFKNIQILDICDPDWIDGTLIKETLDCVDAVTCPTKAIADFLAQLTDKPIKIIPDRFDISVIPKPKKHTKKAKKVVWFGYSHNAHGLKPALPLLAELGLELIVISDDNPMYLKHSKLKRTFIKYEEKTFYKDIQQADFAVLPIGNRPQDRFKSNNKEVKAILAGLPVAKDIESVEKYMDPKARQSFLDNNYVKIKEEYNVKLSIRQYQELINEIKDQRA